MIGEAACLILPIFLHLGPLGGRDLITDIRGGDHPLVP